MSIDHFSILIDCSPQIILFALNTHEDFIDEKRIPARESHRPRLCPVLVVMVSGTPCSNQHLAVGSPKIDS